MNIYVQDYLYWRIIPMAIICILIPLFLAIFYSTIGKIQQRKRHTKIFPSSMKVYGSLELRIAEAIFVFAFSMAIFSMGLIFINHREVLHKAINDGVNIKTKKFFNQLQLPIDIWLYTLISFGISLLIICILKLVNFTHTIKN